MDLGIDPARVEKALRELISRLDYDLHKYTECDEEDGEDHYPELAEEFIEYYEDSENDEDSEKDDSDAAMKRMRSNR